ncbi:uncharacterized protein LOC130209185 isoform X2 [Pseudoliparis swirei]|uniref:uncharacterized protein LOC130209185 isoform X2 n=1 Tax=Pseudoliparis swirei TaxID=2059687 RepID=UPI0024BE6419|nr:uncharacterized protein LOC130209185 isoform X2 [Pseudoliparis swirei]
MDNINIGNTENMPPSAAVCSGNRLKRRRPPPGVKTCAPTPFDSAPPVNDAASELDAAIACITGDVTFKTPMRSACVKLLTHPVVYSQDIGAQLSAYRQDIGAQLSEDFQCRPVLASAIPSSDDEPLSCAQLYTPSSPQPKKKKKQKKLIHNRAAIPLSRETQTIDNTCSSETQTPREPTTRTIATQTKRCIQTVPKKAIKRTVKASQEPTQTKQLIQTVPKKAIKRSVKASITQVHTGSSSSSSSSSCNVNNTPYDYCADDIEINSGFDATSPQMVIQPMVHTSTDLCLEACDIPSEVLELLASFCPEPLVDGRGVVDNQHTELRGLLGDIQVCISTLDTSHIDLVADLSDRYMSADKTAAVFNTTLLEAINALGVGLSADIHREFSVLNTSLNTLGSTLSARYRAEDQASAIVSTTLLEAISALGVGLSDYYRVENKTIIDAVNTLGVTLVRIAQQVVLRSNANNTITRALITTIHNHV